MSLFYTYFELLQMYMNFSGCVSDTIYGVHRYTIPIPSLDKRLQIYGTFTAHSTCRPAQALLALQGCSLLMSCHGKIKWTKWDLSPNFLRHNIPDLLVGRNHVQSRLWLSVVQSK